MRAILVLLLAVLEASAQTLPISGIAHVAFRVSDLDQARRFYTGVLGYEEPFEFSDNGKTTVAFFKVNERQYVELYPNLPSGEDIRLGHVCLETPDIQALHRRLDAMGLKPAKVRKARAGNLLTDIRDPDGQLVEFLEYQPDSLHTGAAGKALGKGRISDHLMHAGVTARNLEASLAFYRDKLGMQEVWRGGPTDNEVRWVNLLIPGERGDSIELMVSPEKPSRGQLGSMQHICLEVPDIPASWKTLLGRGVPDEARYQPRVGRNRRRLLNLFDPDGSRVELMEPRTADGRQAPRSARQPGDRTPVCPRSCHSYRRATVGSTLVARRAGR